MKVNWLQVLKTGLGVGKMFLPRLVSDAVDAIEDNVAVMVRDGWQGWSGPEKQAKALDTLLKSVMVAEGIRDRDLLQDEQVAVAGRKAINTAVAFKQAVAELQETIRAFEASRPAAAPDGTGLP